MMVCPWCVILMFLGSCCPLGVFPRVLVMAYGWVMSLVWPSFVLR